MSNVLPKAFSDFRHLNYGGDCLKCAILSAPGAFKITQLPEPVCNEFDVLVKVDTCGVCRTDRKAFAMGQRDLSFPRILGHEITGTVWKVGAGVTGYSIGERVQVSPGIFCGECKYCLLGIDQLCEKIRIIGFHLDGGFAEYIHIPGQGGEPIILNKISYDLDMAIAALAEPLACSINIQKRMVMDQAEHVVIYGAGPLGILSAKLARSLGADKIIIIEANISRLHHAAECSDYQISAKDDVIGQIMKITKGAGADAVIPCCPGNEPFFTGLELTSKRGRFGFFSGLVDKTRLSSNTLNTIHYREITVVGAYGCSLRDNREALEKLTHGKVNVKGLPALYVSWKELPEIISQLEPHDHIFTYFKPS